MQLVGRPVAPRKSQGIVISKESEWPGLPTPAAIRTSNGARKSVGDCMP